MMLWLIAFRLLGATQTQRLANLPVLKPFIRSGYSIYLWQGRGYSAAAALGRPMGWSPYLIWPLAIAITIGVGLLMSPIERVRVR